MKFWKKSRAAFIGVALPVLVGTAALASRGSDVIPQEAKHPAVSEFAPAGDLLALTKDYATEAGAIADAADEFAKDDQRTKLHQLAESIQIMTLALARHDKLPAPLKAGHFAAAYAAAGELYAATDQATAAAANAKLQKALAGELESSELPEWGHTDQMYDLMNQVQIAASAADRGLRRLARRPDPVLQNAAFLAAVGNEINFMPPQDLSAELVTRWHELSVEMRAAAAALNTAAHAKDEAAATEASQRMTKSCEACHAEIRDK